MAYLLRSGSMLTDQGMIMPWGFLGAELHFLPMMSFELDGRLRFLLISIYCGITCFCPAPVC